jgi:hypothetical protein
MLAASIVIASKICRSSLAAEDELVRAVNGQGTYHRSSKVIAAAFREIQKSVQLELVANITTDEKR